MSFFSLAAKDIKDKLFNFGLFKDKKCFLVVNVASQWGLTNRDYTQLTKMYEELAPQGLEILGFPCNQFGAQEPWSEDKIL